MSLSWWREEICRVGESLFARGYVHGTAGNISVRLDTDLGGGYLITPTDACLGRLDPARLSHLDASLNLLEGDRPSKTIVLHHRIYAAARRFDPDTRCVIHTHSSHCVALSLRDPPPPDTPWLPALTPYFVMKVGPVPLIAYHRPGDPQVAERVAEAIATWGHRGAAPRAVMLERLGPNVWHQSPIAAMATLEELEETARLWVTALDAGRSPAPLAEPQIEALRQHFGARW
jgi:ribulose-5-phosphate 4-epimerase/fuculose-1-phosphate aldolase